MDLTTIITYVEALIFASEKPISEIELMDYIKKIEDLKEEVDLINMDTIQVAIQTITEKYKSEFYVFEVRYVGGGYQFLTKPQFFKSISLINEEKHIKRLSLAALETLSIVAYKQPISKSEIEIIRGVNSDYVLQKLLEKELIIIAGRNDSLPGHPLIYHTSQYFMDYFGINSKDELPKIKEIYSTEIVVPTTIDPNNPIT